MSESLDRKITAGSLLRFALPTIISNIFMGVTAIISVVSGAVYMANGWKTINFKD